MTGSFGGIKAGRAFVLIEAIDMTGKVMNSIRQRLGKFGTEISNVGRTIAMRAAAALLPAGVAVKVGTQYDDIMRKVEARSTGTAAEMENLREQTTKLGRELGLLPTELGRVQNVFAQAGFSRGEIGHIGPAVGLLARAGGEGYDAFKDTENAAKAVTSVIRGFELGAEDAEMVVDKLAVALNASNYNLEDITTSLQYAVPAAKQYNVSLDHMLATLAAMRDLQIDPSIAGTAFKNMMFYMSQAKEREDFNTRLKELTGNTVEFLNATGDLQSPLLIMQAILRATSKLGTAERSDLISQLLETRATVPAVAVGRSTERIAETLTLLENYHGVARRIQQQMDTGLGGSFRRLAARIQEVAINLQQSLTPTLIVLSGIAEKVSTILIDWMKTHKGLTTIIVASVAVLGAFGIGLIVIGQTLRMVSGSLWLFIIPSKLLFTTLFLTAKAAALAFVFLTTPAGMLVVAIGALIAIFLRWEHVLAGYNSAAGAAVSMTTTLRARIGQLGGVLSGLAAEWTSSFGSITKSMEQGDLDSAFKVAAEAMKITWLETIHWMKTQWEDFVNYVRQIGRYGGAGMGDFLGESIMNTASGGTFSWDLFTRPFRPHMEETLSNYDKEDSAQSKQAQNARQQQIDAVKDSLDAARKEARARAAIAEIDAHDEALYRESLSRATDASAKRAELEAAAGGLLGSSDIMPSGVIKPNAAIEKDSVEAAKAIQQDKYGLHKKLDTAIATIGRMATDLAAIKSNTATPTVGVV